MISRKKGDSKSGRKYINTLYIIGHSSLLLTKDFFPLAVLVCWRIFWKPLCRIPLCVWPHPPSPAWSPSVCPSAATFCPATDYSIWVFFLDGFVARFIWVRKINWFVLTWWILFLTILCILCWGRYYGTCHAVFKECIVWKSDIIGLLILLGDKDTRNFRIREENK